MGAAGGAERHAHRAAHRESPAPDSPRPLACRDRIDPRRVLRPKGELHDVYRIDGLDTRQTDNISCSADGRFLAIDRRSQPALLYDGLTGTPVSLEATGLTAIARASVSESGEVLTLAEIAGHGTDTYRFRLPGLTPLGHDPQSLETIDDANKLGANSGPAPSQGVALYRVGDDRPLVVFDAGLPPLGRQRDAPSPDGRFIIWGRRDGTVCVADVNKCMEDLGPFGKP